MPIYFILFFLVLQLNGYSQCPETNPNCNQVKNWICSDSTRIIFQNDSIIFQDINLDICEATTSFLDLDYELLFYANSNSIYSKNGKVLYKLKGDKSSRQGALFVFNSINDSNIFILTSDAAESKKRNLYLHSISKNSNSSILNKLLLNEVSEALKSTNHLNNKSVWILAHKNNSNKFCSFLLQNNEFICCPIVQGIGGDFSKGDLSKKQNGMQFSISSNNKYLVSFGSESDFGGLERVDIFKMNTEYFKLNSNNVIWQTILRGASFSPNSQYLYLNNNRIIQYQIEEINDSIFIENYFFVTPTWNNSLNYSQIGPNGKIYYSYYDSLNFGVLEFPDSFEAKCSYIEKGLLLPRVGKYMQPNFNTSYFYTPSIDFAYTEDCENHIYQFEGRDTFEADGYKWIFKKGNYTDSLLTKHGQYQFIDTGKWQVSHIAWNANRADTVTKTLTLYPKWENEVLGNDTFYCQGQSPQLILKTPFDMHCVHWQGQEPNLDEDLGPIVDYNHFHIDSLVIDTAGIYTVKLTNKTFCQLWDTIKVEEKPTPEKPIISFATGELASTIIAKNYTWYINDSFYTSTNNRSILPNRNGYYQLVLTSEFGCQSEKSDSFFVDLESIAPIQSNYLFKVYPNPNKGSFSIQVIKPGMYHIEITDVIGKQVYTAQERITITKELNLQLSQGNYLVTVMDANGNRSTRQFKVE
jgi:hypothetical protein